MLLGIITLVAALSISVVAAYFSIIGLAALFAAAALPVIIMGSVLEVGKLVSVVWLHNNWKTSPNILKYYLTSSVVVLMIITSLGIFGFLSKGHLDQNVPADSLDIKIERIDHKIKSEERIVSRLQKRIDQLDDSISVYFDNDFATRGLKALDEQKNEREAIQKEINEREIRIDSYMEQLSNEQIEKNEITAKLGPVKYISDLVFENPEDNIDAAVRGVILMIVFAFDPLAVLLLIAATHTFTLARNTRKTNDKDIDNENIVEHNEDIKYEDIKWPEEVVEDDNRIVGSSETVGVYSEDPPYSTKGFDLPSEDVDSVIQDDSSEDIDSNNSIGEEYVDELSDQIPDEEIVPDNEIPPENIVEKNSEERVSKIEKIRADKNNVWTTRKPGSAPIKIK